MKTISKILVCICIATSVNAQYFTGEYGATSALDQLTDGALASSTPAGPGHLITGTNNALGSTFLTLTRMDNNGSPLSIGCFNNIYKLQNASGVDVIATPVKVLELPSGIIVVAGSYTNIPSAPTEFGVFIARFSLSGSVLTVVGYASTSTAQGIISMASACLNLGSSPIIYCVGQLNLVPVLGPNTGTGIFVIGYDAQANSQVFTRIYNILNTFTRTETSADIITSPWITNQLVIIGNYTAFGSGDPGAFSFRVNKTNGNPVGSVNIYNYVGSVETVKSITTSNSTSGFTICGSSNNSSPTYRVWAFKVTSTGVASGTLPKKFISYSSTSGGDYTATDIVERQNTSLNYEYYISATIANGIFGFQDMVIVKLDDLLNPSTAGNNEFTYGSSTANESSQEITAFTNGITIYGNINMAFYDEMQVTKAYYNGVTECPNSLNIATAVPSPSLSGTTTFVAVGNLVIYNIIGLQINTLTYYRRCNSATLPGGSNARLAEEEQTTMSSSTQVWPNPVSAGASDLQINLNLPTEEQVQFRIVDINGRIVVNQTITVSEGNSIQTIGLPSDLSAGMYMIQINGTTIHEVKRFVVE